MVNNFKEIARFVNPYAGKTGVMNVVDSVEFEIDGAFVTEMSYLVVQEGIVRKKFSYRVSEDDKAETERGRKKAEFQAQKYLDLLNKSESFTEYVAK